MNNKALVYGYKKINLGDDLFFSILFQKYPNTKFIFQGQKAYKKIFKHNKNVKVISPYSPFDLFLSFVDKVSQTKTESTLEKLAKYKVLITGSGFREGSNKSECHKHINNLFIISSNFGPYYTEKFLKQNKQFFKNCIDVCFRDSQSYNLFSDLPNTHFAPDVVFDINTYYPSLSTNTPFFKSNNLCGQKYAVISLLSFEKRSKNSSLQKEYISGIKTIINHLISKNHKIVLMAFCEAEGDCNSFNELLEDDFIKANSYAYTYDGNIPEALAIIENSETVIATRFHSMVLGLAMNKKTLPIIYDSKMSNVLNDLGVKQFLDVKSIQDITPQYFEEWYNNYHFIDCKKLASDAKQQFATLDNFLN